MTFRPYDTALVLKAPGGSDITSTAAETAIALPVRSAGLFKAVITATKVDRTTGDETYVIAIETDSAVGFPSSVTVGSVSITAAGMYEVLLSGDGIAALDATAAAVRVKATLSGTTPILNYHAFITPAS
jgi:hypothetical protein